MSSPARVRVDRKGVRDLLNSAMLTAPLVTAAEEIKARAEADAPTATGRYRSSFEVWARRRMGVRRDRTGAVVINTAAHARFVEYGDHATPGRHTLLRAASGMRLP